MATQAELDTHKTSADHDDRYYTETEINAKLGVRGRVNADGTIAKGSGFTVVKLGTGSYEVQLSSAVTGTEPYVTGMVIGAGQINLDISVAPTSSTFRFVTFTASGTLSDRAFAFEAKPY